MEPTSTSITINASAAIEILEHFIRDGVHNAGFQKGVIGVSGGIDSAVSAYLTTRALGKENTIAILLPHKSSLPQSLNDGKKVVDGLGIRSETVDITAMVEGYCQPNNVTDTLRRGNVMARSRMIVLYDISARENALVIGTSNKTELLVGYGTLHGDMASALNPIGDLYKTQVRQIATALGVPKEIVEKHPTADLWAGQTDEAELGCTYAELDSLLYAMIDERKSDKELKAMGFKPEFIVSIQDKIRKSQFKRQLPVIAKLSNRTINVDFRYVRDWGI